MEAKFNYINKKDIYQYKFYTIPKELFVNERYNFLSSDAKLLYGILLDRITLSMKNNWIDKNGNVYLIFTRKEIQTLLNISDKTCTKVFKELVSCNLLLEKEQGRTKPKLLYPAQITHDTRFDNLNRKNYDLTIQIITNILIELKRVNHGNMKIKGNIVKNFLIAYMLI